MSPKTIYRLCGNVREKPALDGGRLSRRRGEDVGIKDLRVANPNETQIRQASAEALKMTFQVIDPMQVT